MIVNRDKPDPDCPYPLGLRWGVVVPGLAATSVGQRPAYAIGDLGDAVKGQAGLVRASAGRRMTGTGMCIALIAAGAILRFAVGAGSRHGLDVHAVGVIVIGAGEVGLLWLLVWGPLNPAWRHRHST